MDGLKNIGFKGVYPIPCIMWRKNHLGMIFIELYVDDLCTGNKHAITSLEKEFVNEGSQVMPPEEMNDYLS